MELWKQEYLAHHGILGMKWGRRNGPPYPLSADRHSESEKRAGWRKSLNSKVQEKIRYSKDKRELKKKIRKAYENRNSEGAKTGRVIDSYKKEVEGNKKIKYNNRKEKSLRALSDLTQEKIDQDYDSNSVYAELASDFFTDEADNIYNANTEELKKISNKYVNLFNDALLDDINWKESKEKGRKYLEKYGQEFKVNSDGEIVRGFWEIGDFGKPVDREDL